MTQPHEDHEARRADRRGIKVLSLAGGAALGVLVIALGGPDPDAATDPWIDTAPALVPAVAASESETRLDAGVNWERVEVWHEFGPAAVAAYER